MHLILAIDDDPSARFLFKEALAVDGERVVETAATAAEGMAALRDSEPHVVLLDLVLPDGSGLTLLDKIRAIDRRVPIIVITGEAEAETAIEAMRLGAYDYVAKPVNVAELRDLVNRAVRLRQMTLTPVALSPDGAEEASVNSNGDAFVGSSPAMLEVFKTVGRCAAQRVPVLIRGESGTGKELVARAIYQHSDRSKEPYIAINCAALPDTLLESELFGHEKGSFTSADRRRIGKFEQCNGGTIFLDEIGDMAPIIQAKILRLLQEQQFERVGGNETIRTDVRVIAATNRPLEAMVESGKFRADLLYRLNGVTIMLPPLRERTSDVEVLTRYFLGQATREMSRSDISGMAPETVECILSYPWPGNVRELQSVVRQAVINCNSSVIAPEHLPDDILAGESAVPIPDDDDRGADEPPHPTEDRVAKPSDSGLWRVESRPVEGKPVDLSGFLIKRLEANPTDLYAETIEAVERELFAVVLRYTGGNQSRASEILGITRGKVRDRIAAFDISVDRMSGAD